MHEQQPPLRRYPLTPFLTMFATVCVRISPLIVFMAYAHFSRPTTIRWTALFAAVALLQMLLYFVARRCASSELSYHRGLSIVGACMSTGWLYLDPVFVLIGVTLMHVLSSFIALSPDAPTRYRQLVHLFYRHRMEQ